LKSRLMQLLCRLLVVTLAMLPIQSPQAGMIGAEEVAAQGGRAALLGMIERPELASQLQALGIDPLSAKQRVAALTDAEVRAIADRLDSLPAGAAKNSMWGYVGLLVIAFILWYTWK
jgi:hypothetical protein